MKRYLPVTIFNKYKERTLLFCLLMSVFVIPNSASLLASSPGYAEVSYQNGTLPLSEVLEKMAKLFDINLVYDSDVVAGKTVGEPDYKKIDFEDSLRDILQKFDLSFKKLNKSTYVIVKQKEGSKKINQPLPKPKK